MQRFLSLRNLSKTLTTNITTTTTKSDASSLVHFQPHRTFTCLTKPTPQNSPIHHFCSCQPHSHRTLLGKVHGFLPNPLLSKRFFTECTNAHFRVSTKRLADRKVGIFRALLVRRFSGFNFNSNYGSSYKRSWRSWFHRLSPDSMVLGLIMTNAAVFVLWRILHQDFMKYNFMISLDNFRSGRVHTLVTSAFSHVDLGNIISNMVGLYFFGGHIGRTLGPEFLLKLYLAGAIGGSVFYLLQAGLLAMLLKGLRRGLRDPSWTSGLDLSWISGFDPSWTPGLGASGAVHAVMSLSIFLNPGAIPVPAALLGIILVGISALRVIEVNGIVSVTAPVGGVAVADIALARIRKGRF